MMMLWEGINGVTQLEENMKSCDSVEERSEAV